MHLFFFFFVFSTLDGFSANYCNYLSGAEGNSRRLFNPINEERPDLGGTSVMAGKLIETSNSGASHQCTSWSSRRFTSSVNDLFFASYIIFLPISSRKVRLVYISIFPAPSCFPALCPGGRRRSHYEALIQFITGTKLNLGCQQMCSKLYLLPPSREQLFLFSR